MTMTYNCFAKFSFKILFTPEDPTESTTSHVHDVQQDDVMQQARPNCLPHCQATAAGNHCRPKNQSFHAELPHQSWAAVWQLQWIKF